LHEHLIKSCISIAKQAERHYLIIGVEFHYFYFDIIFILLKFTVAAFPFITIDKHECSETFNQEMPLLLLNKRIKDLTKMSKISEVWHSRSEQDWKNALDNYWNYVKPENLKLERSLNKLKLKRISELDELGWYKFLLRKYFRWKYTSPFFYTTTTRNLKRYLELDQLDILFDIKQRLLNLNLSDVKSALLTANEIRGLGIAGASGLLSLMYPHTFATVDQFVVKALRLVDYLPENTLLVKMKPDSLTLNNGVILINIMSRKAKENNNVFGTDFWTPRKIDMVLWGSRE
jgi:hypothetical protein